MPHSSRRRREAKFCVLWLRFDCCGALPRWVQYARLGANNTVYGQISTIHEFVKAYFNFTLDILLILCMCFLANVRAATRRARNPVPQPFHVFERIWPARQWKRTEGILGRNSQFLVAACTIRTRNPMPVECQRRPCPHQLASCATASTAASTSLDVLYQPKLNRTTPCRSVPRAWCMRGAQCAPGRVAMPYEFHRASDTSAEL